MIMDLRKVAKEVVKDLNSFENKSSAVDKISHRHTSNQIEIVYKRLLEKKVKDLNNFENRSEEAKVEGRKEARIIRLAIETLPDNLLRRVIIKVDGNDLVSDREFDFRPQARNDNFGKNNI